MNNIEIIKKENGSSGRMYVEKYVKNNYFEIYEEILNFCDINNLTELLFKEKVYHYVNDIKHHIYCENPNCNNLVNFKNSTIGYYKYCSKACISSDPKIKKIKEDKSYEKYGTKTPSMNSEIVQKIINTNIERYGVNCPLQNNDIQKKSKETLYINYGVDNPNKSEEIKTKRIESFKKSNYKENYKKTMNDKYGVDYPYQNDIFLKKSKETLYNNYGVDNPYYNDEILNTSQQNKKNNWIKNKLKDDNIIDIDYDNREYIMKCDVGKDHTFKINFNLLKSRKQFAKFMCTECFPEHFNQSSMLEYELQQFIKDNYNGEIVLNDRHIGKELDIFLPKINIAFEFNGIYWHNELYRSSKYHLEKTELCEKNGIKLIHIYQDDWIYKQNIVKSRIINILNLTPNKIFGRKCKIKEIDDNKILRIFLEYNHIQGFIGSQVKIGLFYDNELLSLMTFGKQRKNLGSKHIEDTYELLRYCNKLNTNIVGGASKLFKYFIEKYNPKEIITYADRSWSNGNLYNQLGFDLVHKTQPNYYYVVDGIRKNRFNYRKDILIKNGFDPNKSEHDIMLERKIYRIYDSGHLKFIWKK